MEDCQHGVVQTQHSEGVVEHEAGGLDAVAPAQVLHVPIKIPNTAARLRWSVRLEERGRADGL
jgi:hypothetical protein